MVRFSCFLAHILSHKSKKVIAQSSESMNKSLQDSSQNRELKVSAVPSNLNPLTLETHSNNQCYTSPEEATSSSSQERCWKTEEMHPSPDAEGNKEIHQGVRLNRSRSVGSELDRVGKLCSDEDEAGQGYSGDDSHENNCDKSFDASDHNCDGHELEVDLCNQYHKAPMHDDASFTSGDQDQLEEGPRDNGLELSGEQAEESGNHLSFIPHPIAKSYSMPNFGDLSPTSGEASPSNVHEEPIDRYSQNSDCLDADRKEYWSDDARPRAMSDQEKDNMGVETERERFENSFSDEYDSSNFNGLAKGWSPPGLSVNNRSQSSVSWDELPSKDFKIMRIEEWVSRIDLHDKDQLEEIDEDRCSLQEIGESSHSTEKVKKPSDILGSSVAVKLEGKNPMEAAKKYVSTLTATSTTAQLVNFGLVAVPFLSAFVSLRVLNLSGNAIVRITAGALPRGLHALNLSKNNISTIEGLRELTRLRILDLSYNRISRIGHGLASCASLKELYLAGNKISEVEGFHRLLKLNVLDLRFNKISTSKCLGQLAANYMSLQSISLEGNPAQRNVGEEQLKKYVLSLVPRLVYYNKQPIRVGSSKEAAERPPRSSGHQFDRGLRADAHKLNKKSLHDLATSKLPPSLMTGRAGHAASSSKQSKSRRRLFHSSGTKVTHHHHYPDLGEKLLSMQATFSMRRSQSEGNFLPN